MDAGEGEKEEEEEEEETPFIANEVDSKRDRGGEGGGGGGRCTRRKTTLFRLVGAEGFILYKNPFCKKTNSTREPILYENTFYKKRIRS